MSAAKLTRHLVILIAAGLVTALNYAAWLGWDDERDVHPDGSTTGPYETWQVIGLVVVLAVLAFAVGSYGLPWLGGLVIAVSMALSFSIDASSDPDADGLWPIGAALILIGTACGSMLVAVLAPRRSITRDAPTSGVDVA